MNLLDRKPSTTWERAALLDKPDCRFWMWFRPPHDPASLMLQIPAKRFQSFNDDLTLRRLLLAASVESTQVISWTVQGHTFDAQAGKNPLLDDPVPAPPPEQNTSITVRLNVDPMVVHTPFVPPPIDDPQRMLEAINTDWRAVLILERQLEAVRRTLTATDAKLQSLNRALNPEEHACADNNDRKEWQDTRRWLRDAIALVSRSSRAFDIGIVSVAGNRNWFERIYDDFVRHRKPFPELPTAHQAFQQHRKTTQTLLSQLQSTQTMAANDGIARAQQVLGQIAAKVRDTRAKRGS